MKAMKKTEKERIAMRKLLIALSLIGSFASLFFMTIFRQSRSLSQSLNAIRYVVIGDSYSSGEGVRVADAWPAVLTNHLQAQGIDIELIDNLAKSGWTSEDALRGQLPRFENLQPTFATLMIGANDAFRGVQIEEFRKNFNTLLDRMLAVLPNKDRLLVITIPDYTLSPQGKAYESQTSADIELYNAVIKTEAKNRNLAIVDIFPLSQNLAKDTSMFVADGLHPSAKQLAEWEKVIFQAALSILKNHENPN